MYDGAFKNEWQEPPPPWSAEFLLHTPQNHESAFAIAWPSQLLPRGVQQGLGLCSRCSGSPNPKRYWGFQSLNSAFQNPEAPNFPKPPDPPGPGPLQPCGQRADEAREEEQG